MRVNFWVFFTNGFEIYKNVPDKQLEKASATPLVDPSCPDIELAIECENYCIEDLAICIPRCENDSLCIAECYRAEIDCIDSCPCHTDCPQVTIFTLS